MQVGFVGLGRMGSAMAANLLKAGHALTVHNRTRAKAEPHVSQGARLAETPGEAARGEIVITMLADDHAWRMRRSAPTALSTRSRAAPYTFQ